jgi:GGDEF domain-containing protein
MSVTTKLSHALEADLFEEYKMTAQAQRSRMRFVNYYEHAIQRLIASGITTEQIDRLRDFGLMARDNVTGYYEGRSGRGRFWTLEQAIRHVKETGEEAFYVEMDLRNLGGLNAAIGSTRANEVFSAIATIVRDEFSAIASEAAFFRHGGDETSAYLVNTTKKSVQEAIERVHQDVAKLANEYEINDIQNPKHRDDDRFRGIGVHFGMVPLSAHHEKDPTLVFRHADIEMAQIKKTACWPRPLHFRIETG